MKKLFRNGRIVSDRDVFSGDILVDGEKIAAVGASLSDPDAEVIDVSGKLLLPGAVDVHTHMDLDVGTARAVDDFYSGTVAAVCGGTTTIVDHMAFAHGDTSLWTQVKEYHRLAKNAAVCDYGFHGVLQKMNDEKIGEMREIAAQEGITSFKAYMTYGDNRIDDEMLFRILKAAKEWGIVTAVHCEDNDMVESFRSRFGAEGKTGAEYHPLSRPAEAEAEAVKRLLALAEKAGEAPVYIVHLSSEAGLREVRKARRRGRKHFGVETCPQYLTLTDEWYQREDALKAVMSPPLRTLKDNEALWEALAQGNTIDVIATDHCPFNYLGEKQAGREDFRKCPNGAPGVEERLSIIYSEGVCRGRITLPQMVGYLCADPARIFGLYPKKGALLPGSDADIVVMDPDRKHILSVKDLHGAGDYSCYEGTELTGQIEKVYVRGVLAAEGSAFRLAAGNGRYLRRGISSLASR